MLVPWKFEMLAFILNENYNNIKVLLQQSSKHIFWEILSKGWDLIIFQLVFLKRKYLTFKKNSKVKSFD